MAFIPSFWNYTALFCRIQALRLNFFWRSNQFKILANFRNFWNNGIIFINCKIYLLLQFSFNRFEIIQVSSIGYKHYSFCLVWRSSSVTIFGFFWKCWNFGIMHSSLRLRLLRVSFNRNLTGIYCKRINLESIKNIANSFFLLLVW